MSSSSHSQGEWCERSTSDFSRFPGSSGRPRQAPKLSESAKVAIYKGNLRTGSIISGKARETVLSYDAAAASLE